MDKAAKEARREAQAQRSRLGPAQRAAATGPGAPEPEAGNEAAKPVSDSRYLNGRHPFPSEEEFRQWCDDPVTRFVATGYQQAALMVRDRFLAMTWNSGVSPREGESLTDAAIALAADLAVMRARADAYSAFFETTRSDYAKFIRPEGRAEG